MTDTTLSQSPALFRVQTTGDAPETVVVHIDSDGDYVEAFRKDRLWHVGGANFFPKLSSLNLATLTPLHLLSDAELQARDEALLDLLAVSLADFHCGGIGAVGIINNLRKEPSHER